MRRLVLVVGVLVCGVAGMNQPAFAGCGCEKVKKVSHCGCHRWNWDWFSFGNHCNRCERVSHRSCNRCETVKVASCCEKVTPVATCCEKPTRVATCCDKPVTVTTPCGCNGCQRPYGMTYGTTFMPSTIAYEPSYQPSYETRSTYRAPTTRDVFLTSNQLGANDATFLREAAIANLAEVALGRLALKNASSTEVRNFAQVAIDEHNQAESILENVAARVNVDVPDDLDARREQIERQLSVMTGTDFDRQFMETMVRGHREMIVKFEARAAAAPTNQVQSFAIETLPKLRHHLKMATDIQAKMGW